MSAQTPPRPLSTTAFNGASIRQAHLTIMYVALQRAEDLGAGSPQASRFIEIAQDSGKALMDQLVDKILSAESSDKTAVLIAQSYRDRQGDDIAEYQHLIDKYIPDDTKPGMLAQFYGHETEKAQTALRRMESSADMRGKILAMQQLMFYIKGMQRYNTLHCVKTGVTTTVPQLVAVK